MASTGVYFLPLWLLLPFLFLLISENIKFGVCSRTLSPNQPAEVQPQTPETVIQSQAPPPPSFSYYLLAVQWPPSVCKSKPSGFCRTPVPIDDFTIHGLWPQNDRYPHPRRCDSSNKFNIANVKTIRGELDKNWPTLLTSNTNEGFWDHEWEYHGTCSGLNQTEYFQKTLNLFSQVKLLSKLKAIGVVPDDTAKYDPPTVASKYGSKYSAKPRITCVVKTGTPDLVEMFGEFRIKVNKDAQTIESFTGNTTSSCRTQTVGFPKTA